MKARTLVSFALLQIFQSVNGHAMLLKPPNRSPSKSQTYGDDDNTMGCPVPSSDAVPPTIVEAGKPMTVQYGRNNHVGGFIRYSIIRKGEKETKENFDKNVFWFNCRENVCGPNRRDMGNPILDSGDNSDAGTIFDNGKRINAILCTYQITVPAWLQSGEYVLQWTQYGIGHNNGDPKAPVSIYRSCSDLIVKNAVAEDVQNPGCATFVGGDRTTRGCAKTPDAPGCRGINSFDQGVQAPEDTCVYFDSNELVGTFNKQCREEDPSKCYFFGKPKSQIPLCSSSGSQSPSLEKQSQNITSVAEACPHSTKK